MKCLCQATLGRGGCDNERPVMLPLCSDCYERGCSHPPLRRAIVESPAALEEVSNYLPSNYWVFRDYDGPLEIRGFDDRGWTLDGYVIPRLASGLIAVREVKE